MNHQTLSYHTKLHDWYRQHSIQQDRQSEARAAPKATNPSNDLIALGVLSRDKLQFINEWCSDVNHTMFSIKKKEASPLYRKCRLSAPIKAAMKDRMAGTRRVRSAEVFTLRGQWTKAPKVNIKGGELLPHSKNGGNSATYSEGRKTKEYNSNGSTLGGDNVDFCVTNSLEKTCDVIPLMPRVNHDSFDRRIHPSCIKKNTHLHSVISPRVDKGSRAAITPTRNEKEISQPSTNARAKSASVLRPAQDITEESAQARQNSAKTLPKSHKISNGKGDNQSAEETLKQKQRVTSAGQKSLKASTDLNTSVGDAEIRGILSATDHDISREGFPTFCSKCSGIYAGNAPPPPTPVTCGSCVHGITINGEKPSQEGMGPSNAEIQKELAQRLVKTEKLYHKKITNANVELKMAESRVTEDSIHYSQERKIAHHGNSQPATMLLLKSGEDYDFPDDADLSIKNCDNDNDVSLDVVEYKPVHDDERGNVEDNEERAIDKTSNEDRLHIPTVTILTEDNHKDADEREETEDWDKRDSIALDNDKLINSLNKGKNSRRMSIHFTYKPEVGNLSISNQLLHVLSIDDCKQAMRYHPHKILERHEVSEMLMLTSNMAQSTHDNNDENTSSAGKHAMRISKGSTITSLPSSTANNATNANKKQYKILFDPEDLDYYKHKRPSSLSIAKAFNTLIYDRTIMQRLESIGSSLKSKALNNVGRTNEGPKYRLINASLKKQMGEKMQAQRQQLVHRYQRKKSGLHPTNRQVQTSSLSQSSERSLSLESLPSVQRGIWRDSNESLH